MMRRMAASSVVAVCGLCWVIGGEALALQRDSRAGRDLNGTWQFRLDPNNEGVAGRWFTPGVAYPDAIKVPGNWQAQGYGPSRGNLRHDYQGRAWYRRSVLAPAEWAGKRVWLCFGGVTNTADIYVNGVKVGAVEGYTVPYEFDVTETIRLGAENSIVCSVLSTGLSQRGLFNYAGRWGGLYRGVRLEARSDPAVDDVFVVPDVKHRSARVQVTLSRSAGGPAWQGRARISVVPATGGTAREGQGEIAFAAGCRASQPATVDVAIPDRHAWSPEDPFLYRVEISLQAAGKTIDVVGDRFGMRQFEVGPGGVLLLNGRPYFVRGIGDDTVEVIRGTQYPDKQIYIDRLRQIKRYGFNGVRFLGNTPIPEYFQAADEVGVLVMAEGHIYASPKAPIPLLRNDVARIAKAYRNHPSWYIWSAGNELFCCQGAKPDREWMDYIRFAHAEFKRVDPSRFFVASDGTDVFPTDIITQRGKFDDVRKASPASDAEYRQRPQIWHEFPNTYIGPLPDLTIADRWTGVYQDPDCIAHARRQIAGLGLLDRYPGIRQRSLEMFRRYLKLYFEQARHSPTMDGYAYWCMTDFTPGPEGDMTTFGMFNTLYEPDKFPTPEPVLQFNRESVLLVDLDAGPAGRVLESGTTRTVQLSISHYGEQPIRAGRVSWVLKSDGKPIQEGTISPVEVRVGEVKTLASIALRPGGVEVAQRLDLHVRLESPACRQENQWDLWCFPDAADRLRRLPILNQTGRKELDDRYGLAASRPADAAKLIVANRVTPEVVQALAVGKPVVLLAEDGVLARPGDFTFWPKWIRTTASVVEEHAAMARFPHQGFCDFQFFRLFGKGVPSIPLTEQGSIEREKLVPIVWGLCQDYDPSLGMNWSNPRNRWKVFRHGLICEGRVGGGKLLVCSLRVVRGIAARHAESLALLDSLVEYALSERFAPSAPPMTPADFRKLFKVSESETRNVP